MPKPHKGVIFVGPSLADIPPRRMSDLALQVRPPAKRGDVAAVTRTRRPGVLVLVDGVFQNALSVGHAELREALNLGWEVWGLSSMGAIRAREMHVLGMRGWGRVFETFMAPGDFQDDEVALLHGAEKPYVALSEPLIHLRAATAHLAEIGILSPSAADQILAGLKSLWYGQRTLSLFFAIVERTVSASAAPAAKDALRNFDQFRLKSHDLRQFLEETPWNR